MFGSLNYIADPHTAVGIGVYEDYVKNTGDTTKTLIASTASPYKFPKSVLDALDVNTEGSDEFEMAEKLFEICGLEIPAQIKELKNLEVRFNGVCNKEEMEQTVYNMLG